MASIACVGLPETAAACSSENTSASDPDRNSDRSIKLKTSWVPSVQFGDTYVADKRGYFARKGVKVTILAGGPDVDTLAAVESGQADIAMSNTDTVAQANANGAGLVIVAAGNQKNPLVIRSAPSNPIRTPADTEGMRIGVPTVDEAVNAALIKANDLDAGKITEVPVGFDVAPLVSGQVDGIWGIYSGQPVAYENSTGHAGVSLLTADNGLDLYTDVYVVKQDDLTDHDKKSAIEAFLKADIEGWQECVADPTKCAELAVDDYGKAGGLKLEQQTQQAHLQLDLDVTAETKAHGLFWISDEGITKNLATLAALGIKADESLFDTSLLSDIYNGENTIG
jgi:ABC-type nitrate/sulfonate/bicarbonate transport system substrate-binding protein